MPGLPLVVNDMGRWYAATTLALGARTGLLDALLAGGGRAADLAAQAGVDAHNATVWADAMVAAGYARAEGERYLADEDALGVMRGGFPFDLRAAIELLAPLGGMLPRVERAMRDGGGITPAKIQAALGPLPERVNGPMYEAFLRDGWIAAHPEIQAGLRSGIDVAEVGPGGGEALRLLAAAFPASRFVGYDLDPRQVARANAAAAGAGLSNLRFEALDAALLPAASLDLVCAFDAFHHFGRPAAVIEAVRVALRDGGSLLIAESSLSGDPATDAADPFAIIVYGSNLLYCFQESMSDGGVGLGATWAGRHLAAFLGEHGFRVAGTHVSEAGYAVVRAMPVARG